MQELNEFWKEKSNDLSKLLSITKHQAKKILFKRALLNEKDKTLLSEIIDSWDKKVSKCKSCNALILNEKCPFEKNRNNDILCVVDSQYVLNMMEEHSFFQGIYFVLNIKIDEEKDLKKIKEIKKLEFLVQEKKVKELVIATSPTIDGEMLTTLLVSFFSKIIKTTRLAYGISFGSKLDFVNPNTLKHAYLNRKERNA